MRETPIGKLLDIPYTREAKIDRLDRAINLLTDGQRLSRQEKLDIAQWLFSVRQGLKQEED